MRSRPQWVESCHKDRRFLQSAKATPTMWWTMRGGRSDRWI